VGELVGAARDSGREADRGVEWRRDRRKKELREMREECWKRRRTQVKNELRRRRDRARGEERVELQLRYRLVREEVRRRTRRGVRVKKRVNEDIEKIKDRDPRL